MSTTSKTPDLKLFFLQGSRAIRIAWLLTELSIPYENIFFVRNKKKLAPADMKEKSGSALGKSPVLRDGELVLAESGAITEYILQTYDPLHTFFGNGTIQKREEIRKFIHLSEGTFMMHMLPIPFSRWFAPLDSPDRLAIEHGVLAMVWRDLDWLNTHLLDTKTDYLVGDTLTAADTMMLFPVQLIFKRYCGGREMGEWEGVKGWVERCEGREGWKRCLEKTGYELP